MGNWTAANIPPQKGKLAIVTGGNSGIGWQTAFELARAGAEVIVSARTAEKGHQATEQIRKEFPQANVRFELLDLASLSSVRAFAAKIRDELRVDILVNNAGVMNVPSRELTEDGFERQFGTNFLGPFALTCLVMPALRRSPSPRVTTVSSGAANMGTKKINFDDLQWAQSYGPWKAYCQSKLADLMFALELGHRCDAAEIPLLSDAAHPGYARTNLQTSGQGRSESLPQRILERFISQDAVQGALPRLRAVTATDAVQGSYYGPHSLFGLKGSPILVPIPKPAQDEAARHHLWEEAEQLTGIRWAEVASLPQVNPV